MFSEFLWNYYFFEIIVYIFKKTVTWTIKKSSKRLIKLDYILFDIYYSWQFFHLE